MTTAAEFLPIQITPGVQPVADRSPFSTPHWTDAQHIRFRDGFPEKIGGWVSVKFDYSNTMTGMVRTIYSAEISDNIVTICGSHKNLYSVVGSRLTNITPLKTGSTAIPNSLENDYYSGATTLYTTSGSKMVRVVYAIAPHYRVGDTITLGGFSGIAGIPAGEINTSHIIRAIGVNYIDFTVATAANATTSAVNLGITAASGWLQVTAAAHGLLDGARVKISGAVAVGGVLAADINKEFVIRNVTTNTFDIITEGTATSAATAAGGAATVYYPQISDGDADESSGRGYGMGRYGMGLYGTALVSSSTRRLPRIWFCDRFADTLIMTPGNQGGVYRWDGDTAVAPVLLSGAPTAVNYVFVSDNIVVTLGANGVPNRIKTSDQGVPTNWTASSTNQVYEDDIEGAGRFIGHLSISGANLLFTLTQTWLFRKIEGNEIWSISLLDGNIGMISPRAGCVIGGVAYWQGRNNWYRWSGGNIEIMPSNTLERSTIWRHTYDDITTGQRSKSFCWHNAHFDEIWWHNPAADANEPNKIARVNVSDLTWVPDELDRTAAEYPNIMAPYPRLADSAATLYYHENGTDADTVAMPFSITSPYRGGGKYNSTLTEVIPDSQQVGDITLTIDTRRYPQSSNYVYHQAVTISPVTERVPVTAGGRFWRYTINGEALGQYWVAGQWYEAVQKGAQQ